MQIFSGVKVVGKNTSLLFITTKLRKIATRARLFRLWTHRK